MEIGGNDQTFNMLAGRTLMKKMKNKEKFVLATKLLTDPSGIKMGKTEGNMIDLDMEPNEMYGRVMSWSDSLIGIGFEICTGVSFDEVNKIKEELNAGKINSRDIKMRLAFEIVKMYHSEKEAKKARENFIKLFQKKETPDDIPEIKTKKGKELNEILTENKIISSKSEFRRLVKEGAVDVDGKTINDIRFTIEKTSIVKIGKRKFVKITLL
jgi:tyrosyl-tRNA synthetase